MEFLTKSIKAEISDFDDKQGYVDGYLNNYNVKDSHGDISDPSSFIKTVSERFSKIRVHKNHDPSIIIGVPKELDPHDSNGLRGVTKFQMNTDAGRDAYYDVKLIHENGQDADISIGAWVVKRDKRDKGRVLEYKMKEYSFLTTEGSNPLSRALSVKSINDLPENIIEYLTKAYNLPYSDERLQNLETILKSLTIEPEVDKGKTTREVKPTIYYTNLI